MIRLLKFIKPLDKLIALCLFFISFASYSKEIPGVIYFGNIKLKLTEDAKRQIQLNINELLKDQSSFQKTIKNIEVLSPIIENILREEGLPTDFKYLAVQNSVLGFWQLDKKFATTELNMQVNEEVDERMDIVTATKVTARYLRRNNLFFRNWLFTMLSLKVGYEEARKYVTNHYSKEDYIGVQTLEINGNTPNYLLNFLAHKIAYEEEIKKSNAVVKMKLMQYTGGANKTLSQIAHQFKVEESELYELNKWLKRNRIPSNRTYHVLIPETNDNSLVRIDNEPEEKEVIQDKSFVKKKDTETVVEENIQKKESSQSNPFNNIEVQDHNNNGLEVEIKRKEDLLKEQNQNNTNTIKTGLPKYHIVSPGQTPYTVAAKYGITIAELLYWNKLSSQDMIYSGQKLIVSPVEIVKEYESHVVVEGETLSQIAQYYGVTVNEIANWNKLEIEGILEIGQRLMIYKKIYRASGDQEETFFQKSKHAQVSEKLSNNSINKSNKKIKK